jgi:hypothetical protein
MEVLVIRGGLTYRLVEGDPDIDALVEYLVTDKAECIGKLKMLSRQQVTMRLGRATLPSNFIDEVGTIGDDLRETGFSRGWLESSVAAWEAAQLADDTDKPAEAADTAAPDEAVPPKKTRSRRSKTDQAAAVDDQPASAATPDPNAPFPVKSQQWDGVPISADGRILLMTSRGVLSPSGRVVAGPLPDGSALGTLLTWKWPRKPKGLPQFWFTYEALERIGFPTSAEDGEELDAKDLVSTMFDCTVTYSQSGWFTCKFVDGPNEERQAHIVIVPLLDTDPPEERPGDMGIGGWLDTPTELPEGELEAARLLGDRMAWLAGLADDVVPASGWATVGAQMLDSVRTRARIKGIQGCPLPAPVAVETGGWLEPIIPPKWDQRTHKAKGDDIDVEADQRAAYLASAIQVKLGYGKPRELQRINVEVFNGQKPPYGIWRLTAPAGNTIDGLANQLPLPHPYMRWDQETSFWITTRGVQHLTAPVELGGAGLAYNELDIDSAWVWPDQSELLKTWADRLRVALIEAKKAGRDDYEDFIKGIYAAYLGRMSTEKWKPSQSQHQQPTWYATIIADTRWRAMKYARRIADTHNRYPVYSELDSWIYRVPADFDLSIFDEHSTDNGKYRVKWSDLEDAAHDQRGDAK